MLRAGSDSPRLAQIHPEHGPRQGAGCCPALARSRLSSPKDRGLRHTAVPLPQTGHRDGKGPGRFRPDQTPLLPLTGLWVLPQPHLEDGGGSAPSPVPGPCRIGLRSPLWAARDLSMSPGGRWGRSCGPQAPAPTHQPSPPSHAGDSCHSLLEAPGDRQCPPPRPPPRSRAPLARGVSCIPAPARPWVCPSDRGFIVSQRGPGQPPLSHAGPWEPPESTLPLPAAPPGRQRRPGSRLRALWGRVMGMPGCAAQAPQAGNLVQHCQTGSDERAAPAAKSSTSFPPHCGRKLLPKKSRPGVRLVCGASRPGPPALAAQHRGGEMPPIATRGICPPPLRLRFHNVSSDLSTSCHQMSHPAPTRSISPQGDRVSPERYRHSRLQQVCRPRWVTPWPAEAGSGVAPTF